ncbi:MAG TPA: hypothetical protein VFU36_05540 [Jatrophihabitans sp.]|nr:hypothetical protein [Jatrophihabitans sp.]
MTEWSDDAAELAAEFDAAARRAGIEVPADLREGVLHGYRGLRGLTALLRAEAEAVRAEAVRAEAVQAQAVRAEVADA